MTHINIIKELNEDSVTTPMIISMYKDYFKEVHKDDFIGSEDTIRTMLQKSLADNNIIVLVVDKKNVVGFFEYRMDSESDNIAPFVYLKYMYIRPAHRNGLAIGYIYEYMCLVSHMNDDCKMVGDTYLTSNNIHNNQISEGNVISHTYRFKPKESLMGRRLIKRGLRRYESN